MSECERELSPSSAASPCTDGPVLSSEMRRRRDNPVLDRPLVCAAVAAHIPELSSSSAALCLLEEKLLWGWSWGLGQKEAA